MTALCGKVKSTRPLYVTETSIMSSSQKNMSFTTILKHIPRFKTQEMSSTAFKQNKHRSLRQWKAKDNKGEKVKKCVLPENANFQCALPTASRGSVECAQWKRLKSPTNPKKAYGSYFRPKCKLFLQEQNDVQTCSRQAERCRVMGWKPLEATFNASPLQEVQ